MGCSFNNDLKISWLIGRGGLQVQYQYNTFHFLSENDCNLVILDLECDRWWLLAFKAADWLIAFKVNYFLQNSRTTLDIKHIII